MRSKIVQKIKDLKEPRFCTVATVDTKGSPWSAPLFFAYDEAGRIFWTSAVDAQHSVNIKDDSRAFVSMISEQPDINNIGNNGLYLQGTARPANSLEEVIKIRELLCERMKITSKNPESFFGDSPRTVYIFTPEKAWCDGMKEVSAHDGGVHDCDVRVEIEFMQGE